MQGSPSGPTSDAASRRLDAVFEALSHERRRTVLRHLRETADGGASVDELAEALAASAGDGRRDGPSVERVAASLVHHHLPKLEDASVVERDESGAVRYTDDPVVTACLDVVAAVESD